MVVVIVVCVCGSSAVRLRCDRAPVEVEVVYCVADGCSGGRLLYGKLVMVESLVAVATRCGDASLGGI